MPRRTNEFQQLVLLIQQSLATENARVEESALLQDYLTGENREVDIAIFASVAGHDFIVSVECVAHRRRATVEWVERMWAKHQSLPTNKLILVSQSGFTSAASAKAGLQNIDVIDLGNALNADWDSVIGQLAQLDIIRVDSTATWCKAVLPEAPTRATSSVASVPLFLPSGEQLGTLHDLIRSYQQSAALKEQIRSRTDAAEGVVQLEGC